MSGSEVALGQVQQCHQGVVGGKPGEVLEVLRRNISSEGSGIGESDGNNFYHSLG